MSDRPQLDLLTAPPPPPTGPQVEPVTAEQNSYRRYAFWKASEAGAKVWRYVEATALQLAARGEQRISVNYIVECARRTEAMKGTKVNNTWRALMADDLVARHPHLLDLIERRKRKRQWPAR